MRGGVRVAGKLRILPGDGQQLNALLGRTGDGDFFSVAFVAGHGFTVFSYRSKDDRWERIGNANAPSLRLGIESTFVVQAKGDALQVQLDEQRWDFNLPRKLTAPERSRASAPRRLEAPVIANTGRRPVRTAGGAGLPSAAQPRGDP